MHLAYSALKSTTKQTPANKTSAANRYTLRYKAYQAACSKYSREITAIQKYMPDWTPTFPGCW